jgi:subtilisin family serine protease
MSHETSHTNFWKALWSNRVGAPLLSTPTQRKLPSEEIFHCRMYSLNCLLTPHPTRYVSTKQSVYTQSDLTGPTAHIRVNTNLNRTELNMSPKIMSHPLQHRLGPVTRRKLFALLVSFAILFVHVHSHAKTILDKKYSGSRQTITYVDGTKKVLKAVKTKTTWANDHVTKTVTYTFADKTTNKVKSTVKPRASGLVLTAAQYPSNWAVRGTVTAPSVSAYKLTYGDKYILTQNGSSSTPFLESSLGSKGITDPNAFVKTASSEIYDLRWGVPDRTGPQTSKEKNVAVKLSLDRVYVYPFSYYWGSLPKFEAKANKTYQEYTGISNSEIQGVWVTNEVRAAWNSGWTGKGVKIGVMDDFTAKDLSDFKAVTVPTSGCRLDSSGTLYTCPTQNKVVLRMTHGQQVAMIAGGENRKFSGAVEEQGTYSTAKDLGEYTMAVTFTANLTSPLYGVAKGAKIYHSDYLTYQNMSLFSQLKKWEEGRNASSVTYKSLNVLNLSLGNTTSNRLINSSTYAKEIKIANGTKINSDIAYIKAAGNSRCNISQMDCDFTNAVFHNSHKYNQKVIIVGALTRSGGALANYSNYAGSYSDRFLVADGRGIQNSDGSYDKGTSFAAPKVAGYAAIVAQKFPNLNAEKLTNVLLRTARYDTLACHPNCRTNLYGRGEASLSRALAPVGKLR